MKKAYSLDYDIERDTDRVVAVREIIDKMDKDPNATDLEQMASYILYGKDENGLNAVQRGETTDGNKRYGSYKRTDDKLLSLDEILDNPLVDQTQLKSAHERDHYLKKKPVVSRPKYNKKTGEMIDPGDSDIPFMVELWDSIDRLDKWIQQLEGKIPPEEGTLLFDDNYRLYQLKHTLIDLRRHQYYLKDVYKPTLHFLALDHPKAQFYDWTGDAFYWMPYEKWKHRVDNTLLNSVSKDIKDYETRGEGDMLEVKWVVRKHTFDWENPNHVRALINNLDMLKDQLSTKLDTYGCTLIWDFDRYRALCNFTPLREFLLDMKIDHIPYDSILEELQIKFGIVYNKNHLCSIFSQEIPGKIAEVAKKERLLIDTPPDQMKVCFKCGKALPRDILFFSRNRSRKDGFSSNCKDCEKIMRIEKGGQTVYDRRSKDTQVLQV